MSVLSFSATAERPRCVEARKIRKNIFSFIFSIVLDIGDGGRGVSRGWGRCGNRECQGLSRPPGFRELNVF